MCIVSLSVDSFVGLSVAEFSFKGMCVTLGSASDQNHFWAISTLSTHASLFSAGFLRCRDGKINWRLSAHSG